MKIRENFITKTDSPVCRLCKKKKKMFLFRDFTANIISLSHGCALGWLSPYLPLLQSDSSPLSTGSISLEETSWIGAILCVGGVVGNSTFGYLCKLIGRKRAITLLAFPNMVSHFPVCPFRFTNKFSCSFHPGILVVHYVRSLRVPSLFSAIFGWMHWRRPVRMHSLVCS